jgi:hypothetical protein
MMKKLEEFENKNKERENIEAEKEFKRELKR